MSTPQHRGEPEDAGASAEERESIRKRSRGAIGGAGGSDDDGNVRVWWRHL